jgi:hypothetical protein
VVSTQGPRWFGRLLALLAFVSILGLVASPVSAREPQRDVFRSSGSVVVADCGGGVFLTDTFTEVDTFVIFFDASGNPIRVQIYQNFDGVITNSASGNTYRDPGHVMLIGDVVNGTLTYHGEYFANVAPGVGIVVQDTGTLTFDADGNIIFQAGPHQVLTGTADPCSVLV